MEQRVGSSTLSTFSKKTAPWGSNKRLPWLDGRNTTAPSSAVTSPAPDMPSSPAQPPPAPLEPSTRADPHITLLPLSKKTAEHSVDNGSEVEKPTGILPVQPRPERRVSSLGPTGPSLAPHARASTFRHSLSARPVPAPIRKETSRLPKKPMRRHSLATKKPEDPIRPASREDSLAPLPDYLERFDTPDSTARPVPVATFGASPPLIAKSVPMSPIFPVPRPGSFTPVTSRRLSDAVKGLEGVVQEAVLTADETEDPAQLAQVLEIIEDARNLVQETAVEPENNLMNTSFPLEATDFYEGVSSLSSNSSGESVHHGPQSSGQHPHHHDRRCNHTESIDWAYYNAKQPVKRMAYSSPSSSDFDDHDRGRSRSRFSTQSDLLLLPEPIQTAPREHVGFVLRPSADRDHSRSRPRRCSSSNSAADPRRRHYNQHHYNYHRQRLHSRDSRSRPRPRRRHRRTRSSELGLFEKSSEEEGLNTAGKPHEIRRHRNELGVRDYQHRLSLHRIHPRQPIARNWRTGRKRITATIACINTSLLGIIVGIYAGEVPRIQYVLADERHRVILGNVVLYAGLALSTFITWPLPLLHGRKPYVLAALALTMPLQFPQAMIVSMPRSPTGFYRDGLLVSRTFTGLILGFANVNFIATLLDLFGASLQSKHPHQEFLVTGDVRRHGGGMGIWLGIWSWCCIGSLSIGFQIGAGIIENLTPDWGFYIVVILLAASLILNVMAPETRRSTYRRSVTDVYDMDENYIMRRVACGEIKLHISTEGPKYWFEEVWAGIKLSMKMLRQPGFLILALYLGWIYAQIVLVIVLLGSLLSRDYKWTPRYVGLGVISIAIGALLAVPMTKAGIFSRERSHPFRTDSMTFEKEIKWTSHLLRRCIFTLALPLMGIAYTVSSAGRPKPYMVPIVFAGVVGFLSILAITECHGLIMETFDTCDLQPGANTKHRLQSMAVQDRRRRTNYTSFPRVSAGIFAAQTLSFIGAAVATYVGGIMTRHLGAQASTGVTAGILFFLTILLTIILARFRKVQVIPNFTSLVVEGTRKRG